eukprot:Stramenopile-MAST_4_protein_3420
MRRAVAFVLLALSAGICAGREEPVYAAESIVDGDDSYVDSVDLADRKAPAKNAGIPQHYSNCWSACKKKSGPCEHVCGTGGLCCRNKHRGGENGCGYRWGGHWKHSCVSSNGVLLTMAPDGNDGKNDNVGSEGRPLATAKKRYRGFKARSRRRKSELSIPSGETPAGTDAQETDTRTKRTCRRHGESKRHGTSVWIFCGDDPMNDGGPNDTGKWGIGKEGPEEALKNCNFAMSKASTYCPSKYNTPSAAKPKCPFESPCNKPCPSANTLWECFGISYKICQSGMSAHYNIQNSKGASDNTKMLRLYQRDCTQPSGEPQGAQETLCSKKIRKNAFKGDLVWCRCNKVGKLIVKKQNCENVGGGRHEVCAWKQGHCVPKPQEQPPDEPPKPSDEPPKSSDEPPKPSDEPPKPSDEPPKLSDEPPKPSDELPKPSDEPQGAQETLCSKEIRKSAFKGDPVWCRCNKVGKLIVKKQNCENVGGGRHEVCAWKQGHCVPKPQEQPPDEPPKPSDEPPKSSDEPPKPSDEPPKSSDEPPKPSDEPPKPSDEPPKPSDEPPKPSDELPKPSDEPQGAQETLCSKEIRKNAFKGDPVWCRCNKVGKLIVKKQNCENVGGGRHEVCAWKQGQCLSKVPPPSEEEKSACEECKKSEMSKTKESLEHVESMMLDTIGNNGKHDLKKEDIDLKKAEKHIAESPPEISEEAEKRANLAESEKIKAKKKQEEFEKVRLNEEEAKRNMANSPSKEASKEADEAVVEKEKKAEELADAVDTFEDSEEKLETTLDTAETGSPKKRKYLSGKIISKVGNKKAAHFLRPSKDKDAPMSKDLPVTEDDIGLAPVKNPDNSPVSEDDDGPEPPRPNNMQPQEASEIKAFVVPKGQ